MKISELKLWTKVTLPNGGYVKARAEGKEFWDAFAKDAEAYQVAHGLAKDAEIPATEWLDLFLRASIDRTFGGFGDIEGEDGTPFPDRDASGKLIPENCLAVLAIDEAMTEWVIARDRLTKERKNRMEEARGNLLMPTDGAVAGPVN